MQSSASSPSSTSSTTTTKLTGHHTTKLMQPSKTTGLKTKSALNNNNPSVLLSNGSGVKGHDLQTSLEIEEISKKISEHADALYQTWKSHGIAPTEFLDIYTAEAAAAAAGSITEDVKSTEGLQKLVNSFVIKDKEQRGVKTLNKSAVKTGGSTNSVGKSETKMTATQQRRSRSPSPSAGSTAATSIMGSSSSNALKASLDKPGDSITIKKSTTPSSSTKISGGTSPLKTAQNSTPSYLVNTQKISRLAEPQTGEGDYAKPTTATSAGTTKFKSNKQVQSAVGNESAKLSTASTAKKTPSKPLDLNFEISLDLNLDIPALTLQQTENLQKIKELLQQETNGPNKGASQGTTKIPSVIIEKSPTISTTKAKVKKSAGESSKKSATLLEEVNRKSAGQEPTTSTKVIKTKTLINASETPQQQTTIKKIGNKTKSSPRSSSPIGSTQQPAQDAVDANVMLLKSALDNHQQHHLQHQGQGQLGSINHTPIATVIDKSNRKSDKNRDTTVSSSGSSSNGNTKKRSTSTSSISNSNSGSLSNGDLGIVIASLDNITVTSEPLSKSKSLSGSAKTAESPAHLNQPAENAESVTTVTAPVHTVKKSLTKSSSSSSSSSSPKTSKSAKEKTKETASSSKSKESTHIREPSPTKSSLENLIEATVNEAEAAAAAAAATTEKTPNMEVARSNGSSMLTPTKLKSNRPLTNGSQEKAVKSPFLTRGSVAERVLMFEKCPDVRNSFLNIKRPDRNDAPPKSLLKAKLHATPPPPPPDHTSLQREIRNTKSVYIPRFYFPHGKPQPTIALERTLRGILSAFDTFPNNQVTRDELPQILKICGLPYYWRMPVMVFCQQNNSGLVERQRFVEFWKQMNVYCHDEASRFVYILSRGQRMRSYILPEDMAPLVQDVVDTHPGLAFLKEATEFHSRYVHTVIARIFYNVNRSWTGKITISELKKSDLLEIIALLEEEDDINQIMAFFSYEHFYVIYCKFWELDKDHDLLINQDDLARHSDHALSTRIVERIFSGCVTRSDNKKTPEDEPKMSYTDFVWFLLSEEDKRTPTAIEYWFRCMDIDGDGVLSMYELEYFYEEQQQRMESIGIESLPFEDCLCQMLDMIKPKRRDAITLGDLKNCKMTHVFFDTFFNLEKYLDHEQRDPFASQRDEYSSDWDRFAAQEYELLITEEND
uniref:EF-hand domain-containing protein n=1 Tax=Stomoxys calcitrans TaxID=35570 RepID=A0A1I8NZS2_STOCA